MKTLEEIREEVRRVKPKLISILKDNGAVTVTQLRANLDELDEVIDRTLLDLIDDGRVDLTDDFKLTLIQ